MLKIDAHQHFWYFNPVRDSWINEEMVVIQRDFLPAELQPILEAHGFDGCVTVQSDQSEEENKFQLANAEQHEFIKGVVGWVNFWGDDVEERLTELSQFKKLKGFRYVLQSEVDRAVMLNPKFMQGISKLNQFGYTYDILVYPDQLPYIKEFVATFPEQRFVIDHLAKPYIKDRNITPWKQDMEAIAAFENVSCKISGLVTEADWKQWKKEDFRPYLDTVVNAFGTNRILYGSDWPVCLVAATYAETLGIVQEYFAAFSQHDQALFFGGNATAFYNLA
ncbi:amidohydrolase family protein [Adhaeribacter aquaticus]|uniref:amidohydrolase family protein n=1 Tax=Adhaeribacter aquaticus TaxID=299567 RepID=UPI0004042DC2|nr:amidohydrolase family protein [Adhaeribacter aquaticus]